MNSFDYLIVAALLVWISFLPVKSCTVVVVVSTGEVVGLEVSMTVACLVTGS